MRAGLSALALLMSALFAPPAPLRAAEVEKCPDMVAGGPTIIRAALAGDRVRLTFIGHASFLIETPGGVTAVTDYNDYVRSSVVPDVATMNKAHSTHNSVHPDPKIKHVLKGWGTDGKAARHDLELGDLRVRNVPTNIRNFDGGTEYYANSIFIFEIAGLCIGHLGHLHQELTSAQLGAIGRLDIVLVPVDGTYTMAQANMLAVLKELKARIVIPMHYFSPSTLARFINGLAGSLDVDYQAGPTVVLSASALPQRPKLIVLPGY